MISGHAEIMWEEFQTLLDVDKIDGMLLGLKVGDTEHLLRSLAHVQPLNADTQRSRASAEKVRRSREKIRSGCCAEDHASSGSNSGGRKAGDPGVLHQSTQGAVIECLAGSKSIRRSFVGGPYKV